jgi:hypothetical protein
MNVYALALILLDQLHELRSVQLAIAALGFDDFRLLLQCEIRPLEFWIHDLLVKTQNLIVANRTRVREIVHAGLTMLGHGDCQWEQIVQDGVGVGDVDDTVVLGDLCHEGARVQVIGNWHADAECEAAGVGGADDVFDAGFGEGVKAAAEVGSVFFGKGAAGEGVARVVVLGGVDACTWLLVPSINEHCL